MQDYKQAWKDRANKKNNTAFDTFNLCLIKAIRAKSNEDKFKIAWAILQRAFTPITNTNKLTNGQTRWNAIADAAGMGAWVLHDSWLLSHLTEAEFKLYRELSRQIRVSIRHRKVPEKQYAFFFCRQDISPEYQLVQNSHAALALGAELAKEKIPTEELYFACMGSKDLEELHATYEFLLNEGIRTVPFYEPDIGNQLTAIATFPIPADKKGFLRQYKRLKFETNVETVG